MSLFSKFFRNPRKRPADETSHDIEKQMGRGFASMILGDCSPTRLPPQFFSAPRDSVYSIFREIVALRIILVVYLTYAYFGSAKDKADRVIASFFANLPEFMQRTGEYSEEQLHEMGSSLKAPHDKYRAFLREQLRGPDPKDIAKIFAEDCGLADNPHVLEAAEGVCSVTIRAIDDAYKTYYVPR